MAVKEKQKQKSKVESAQTETRHALMMRAKDKGIKNFRVLNKKELGQVLADGVAAEQIQKIVSGAVARWKSGWGSRKDKAKTRA